MAEGGCIGEFPHNVIGDELLPLRVVVDKCLDVLLQESARDCHLSFLVHLLFGVKSENRFYRSVREQCSQNWISPASGPICTMVRIYGTDLSGATGSPSTGRRQHSRSFRLPRSLRQCQPERRLVE